MGQKDKRVMIFIDGSNLFGAMRRYSDHIKKPYRVDIKKLMDFLGFNRDLIRTYYYCSKPEGEMAENQRKFLDAIANISGLDLMVKPLKYGKEKGVDVALVTDLLVAGFRDNYDIAIVVSGDEDFENAVEAIKREGKNVEIAMFRNCFSNKLSRVADTKIVLDDLAKNIEKK